MTTARFDRGRGSVKMSLGPFLGREMARLVRGQKAFSDRQGAVIGAGFNLLIVFAYWEWNGWDRSSLVGARRFGQAAFGLLLVGEVMGMQGIVRQVAGSIASERDRKTLDVLLASRLSSAEIVLGTASAALFRYANEVAPAVPFFALLTSLGAVEPALAILAALGLASMALLVAAISAASSVGARTSRGAISTASGLIAAWLLLPPLCVMFRGLAWPAAPPWLTEAVFVLVDAGPAGPWLDPGGAVPLAGGLVVEVGRMVGYQALASLALLAWSAARLRPASRSLRELKGERGRAGRIKAALRRADRRPPCGDDPVLWQEVHAGRREGTGRRIVGRLLGVAMLGTLGVGAWWLAGPAFRELAGRGYGPSPEAASIDLWRLFVELVERLPAAPPPGRARLVFNVALRLASGLFALGWMLAVSATAFQSIEQERKRDTWLGLITTPLTAREILRGKAFGTLWRARWGALTMVVLWTVGLVSGALHPLGYLASLAFLAATGAYAANGGISTALLACRNEASGKTPVPAVSTPKMLLGSLLLVALLVPFLLVLMALVVLHVVLPFALGCVAPLGYEDVAALRGGPFPEFGDWPIPRWVGARVLLIGWLLGTAGVAFRAARAGAGERAAVRRGGRPAGPAPPRSRGGSDRSLAAGSDPGLTGPCVGSGQAV